MDTLPCDLLGKTFKELDPISLCRLAQVSKAFRVPADADEVWRAALRKWFENDSPENFEDVHRTGVLLSYELGILDHQLIY
jgi:hypothetical protein